MSAEDRLRAAAGQAVRDHRAGLIALSHRIHAHPEVAFEEVRACAWLGEALTGLGLATEAGVYDLPTAFAAVSGTGPLAVTVCAEYDALPGIGHACGHNLIAAAAVGAAAALRPLVDDLGITLRVLGTPAEESGGGKIRLAERGAFTGTHAALMVHPAGRDSLRPRMLASVPLLAEYTGTAAHASAWPERGVNAADAVTVAQVGIGLLRQHITATDRIHGIVTHGGDAPNIVPDRTTYAVTVRAERLSGLAALRPRVENCLRAGALATGCELTVRELSPVYADMRHDAGLAGRFGVAAAALGHPPPAPGTDTRPAASSDMGNVSALVPSIHPLLRLDADGASNHQPAFAAACVRDGADELIATAATALAWTVIAAATDPAERARLLSR